MEERPVRRDPLRSGRALAWLCLTALVVVLALAVRGLGSDPLPNRDPVGETFPTVRGESLAGEPLTLPPGEPCVLLVGYVQDAQFDADRWLVGLLQAPPPVRILEVPTLPGLFPRLIGDRIDAGMRSGIPEEDWEVVVTLYGEDARRVAELTGDEEPRNIRVLLLDAGGRIRWFHDRGFSAAKLLELGRVATEL